MADEKLCGLNIFLTVAWIALKFDLVFLCVFQII